MKKFGTRKLKKSDNDLDITSLLDVLVILLVFLLKSYNASDLKVNLAKDLTLPDSKSEDLAPFASVLQINSKKEVFLGSKSIGTLGEDNNLSFIREALYTELKKTKESDRKKSESKKSVITLNILLDQELPYRILKNLMDTAATVGYQQFKFLVRARYQ